MVIDVKTQYTISKVTSHDARLDVLAEITAAVNDGSAIAALMQYFKSCDPNDDTRGALSKRVQKLKSNEEGEFMCELTQKWYNDGVKMATAKDLINIMDTFKVSIESGMHAL